MKDLNLKETPEFTRARLQHFLKELTILCDKYGFYIQGCGCCGSPWVNDIKNNKDYDNLNYGEGGYEVDQ